MVMETYEDEALEFDEYAEERGSDPEDIDEMLDALMETDADEDLAERRRRRGRRRGGFVQRRPVPLAHARPAYRTPMQAGYVTQRQLKDALERVGSDIRRNAQGIKTVNTQLGRLSGQVKDVVAVNAVHKTRINKLDKQMQLDGALEFAAAIQTPLEGGPTQINLANVFRGAIKSGLLGETKGFLANPFVVSGIGLLLNNSGILSGLFPAAPAGRAEVAP